MGYPPAGMGYPPSQVWWGGTWGGVTPSRDGVPLQPGLMGTRGGVPPSRDGVPSWQGYPPHTGQQMEYLTRRGRYASCVHAGGLSCSLFNFVVFFIIVHKILIFSVKGTGGAYSFVKISACNRSVGFSFARIFWNSLLWVWIFQFATGLWHLLNRNICSKYCARNNFISVSIWKRIRLSAVPAVWCGTLKSTAFVKSHGKCSPAIYLNPSENWRTHCFYNHRDPSIRST